MSEVDRFTRVSMDDAALAMSDMAWLECHGTLAQKVRAAVEAYMWSLREIRPFGEGSHIYPSLQDWREYVASAPATPEPEQETRP